jgi:hypothetical protein
MAIFPPSKAERRKPPNGVAIDGSPVSHAKPSDGLRRRASITQINVKANEISNL